MISEEEMDLDCMDIFRIFQNSHMINTTYGVVNATITMKRGFDRW